MRRLLLFAFGGASFGCADIAVALIAGGEVYLAEVIGVGSGGPAASVSEDVAVFPVGRLTFQKREETAAFDLIVGQRSASECGQGGEDIDVSGEAVDVLVGGNFAGPADEERNPDAAFIGCTLETLHVSVKEGVSWGEIFAGRA